MKKNETQVIFAFALLSIFFALLLPMVPALNNVGEKNLQVQEANAGMEKNDAECQSGGEVACDAGGCPGVRRCSGGAWLSCVPARECSPGREVPCALNSCDFGVVRCDSCGQWEECSPN